MSHFQPQVGSERISSRPLHQRTSLTGHSDRWSRESTKNQRTLMQRCWRNFKFTSDKMDWWSMRSRRCLAWLTCRNIAQLSAMSIRTSRCLRRESCQSGKCEFDWNMLVPSLNLLRLILGSTYFGRTFRFCQNLLSAQATRSCAAISFNYKITFNFSLLYSSLCCWHPNI